MQRSPLTPATGCCTCSSAIQGWASECCLGLEEGQGGRLQKWMCVTGNSTDGWWSGFGFLRWVHLWWIAAVTEDNLQRRLSHCCHHGLWLNSSKFYFSPSNPKVGIQAAEKEYYLACSTWAERFHLSVHGLSLPGGHPSAYPLCLHSNIGRVCWLVQGHQAAKKHSVWSRALCLLSSHGYASMCHFKVVREMEEQMRRREAGNMS